MILSQLKLLMQMKNIQKLEPKVQLQHNGLLIEVQKFSILFSSHTVKKSLKNILQKRSIHLAL